MTDDDKTLWTLIVRDGVRQGMDEHLAGCHVKHEAEHKELNSKVDETRRFMWFSGGVAAVVGGLIGKAIGK